MVTAELNDPNSSRFGKTKIHVSKLNHKLRECVGIDFIDWWKNMDLFADESKYHPSLLRSFHAAFANHNSKSQIIRIMPVYHLCIRSHLSTYWKTCCPTVAMWPLRFDNMELNFEKLTTTTWTSGKGNQLKSHSQLYELFFKWWAVSTCVAM